MTSSFDLTPAWRPIDLTDAPAEQSGAPLPILVSDQLGRLISGGRNKLHVLEILNRQRLWWSLTPTVLIHGYAVSGGTLFVQDGPVLSAWDLTEAIVSGDGLTTHGMCFAAVNLATGTKVAATGNSISDAQYAALFATSESVPANYSAPVIREHQLGSAGDAVVFVLAADGGLCSLDIGLTNLDITRWDVPAAVGLALIESPDPSDPNRYTCRLAYITDPGDVVVLDASSGTPTMLGRWTAQNPSAQPWNPPVYADGNLWASGVPTASLSALLPPPPSAPVFTTPYLSTAESTGTPTGSFQICDTDKLALLVDGQTQRLLAYSPETRVVDRWPSKTGIPASAETVFWHESADKFPTTIIVVSDALPDGVTFTVLVANTVDAPQPQYATLYPPEPVTLASGSLGLGAFADPSETMTTMLTKPVIVSRTVYALAQTSTGRTVAGAWSLDSLAPVIAPAAVGELRRLATLVVPWRMLVLKSTLTARRVNAWNYWELSELPMGNTTFQVVIGSETLEITTDEDSYVTFDARFTGMTITPPAVSDFSTMQVWVYQKNQPVGAHPVPPSVLSGVPDHTEILSLMRNF
ncbi:hypothetical protein [Rhodococcus sp. IEGM 1379]|uniref:hypothetical protein n=1 Tax=Rhodococcus sp. IEGM 1379 TaxID=3047086 RepID=UPI0024B7B9AB|nr:hypothetical protein [Rhodococcus sp. IEGM 1379]MDI9917645.1 hypothetical protein [Rhodococcus sp. IEGM 1379]